MRQCVSVILFFGFTIKTPIKTKKEALKFPLSSGSKSY